MARFDLLNPAKWGRALGYSHAARVGDLVLLSGQIGADALPDGRHKVVSADLVAQFEKALRNVAALAVEVGSSADGIAEMTVFVTDMKAYRASRAALGKAWKRVMGRHYPAMTLVAVSELFEPEAKVEIRAVAAVG